MNRAEHKTSLIAGIGSALVDILIHEPDHFIETAGAIKGGMTLVDDGVIEQILTQAEGRPVIVPGGSACNTMIGIAKLGGKARFIGKLGEDTFGSLFESGLTNNHLESMLFKSQLSTGRVLSIITPDAQRSMLTYLGAASEISPEEVTSVCFTNAAIVHVEGYLLFNKELIETAMIHAKQVGALVSLDLASFTVVEHSKAFLEKLVNQYVDILIANEDEARAFTGHDDEIRAIRTLSEKARTSVLKVGSRGSYIAHDGKLIRIAPQGNGKAVDTTGAGDLWASGFLFGLVNGFPIEKCGELGSACGYEVCQVVGACVPEDGWQRIRSFLK